MVRISHIYESQNCWHAIINNCMSHSTGTFRLKCNCRFETMSLRAGHKAWRYFQAPKTSGSKNINRSIIRKKMIKYKPLLESQYVSKVRSPDSNISRQFRCIYDVSSSLRMYELESKRLNNIDKAEVNRPRYASDIWKLETHQKIKIEST